MTGEDAVAGGFASREHLKLLDPHRPYGSEPALAVAADLDAKIQSLPETAAR